MIRLNELPAEFISLTPQTKFVIQDTPGSNCQSSSIDKTFEAAAAAAAAGEACESDVDVSFE